MPVWLIAAIPALILRLPLFLLPSPGRDEATYYYWSQHPEPAYAFLLQLFIKAGQLLPLPELLVLRLPSIVSGILIIYLFDLWLRRAGAERNWRVVSALALALCPWQSYTGSILHPDSLLLVTLLLVLLADGANRLLLAAAACGAAILAKPTGFLIAFGWVISLFWRHHQDWKLWLPATVLLAAVASPAVIFLRPEMLQAMAEFGRISPETGLMTKLGLAMMPLLFLGGILVPIGGLTGLQQKYRAWQGGFLHDRQFTATVIALVLLMTFLLAAVFRNQIKANWILPALVILWPAVRPALAWRLRVPGLVFAIIASTGLSLFMANPELAGRVEKVVGLQHSTYALQAGTREARVSASHSWKDRLNEYQCQAAWTQMLQQQWQQAGGAIDGPDWIVSDDYGLAAQLNYAWNKSRARLVIRDDGLFAQTLAQFQNAPKQNVLVLGVQKTARDVCRQLLDPGILKIQDSMQPDLEFGILPGWPASLRKRALDGY